jgi:hypothetical protein
MIKPLLNSTSISIFKRAMLFAFFIFIYQNSLSQTWSALGTGVDSSVFTDVRAIIEHQGNIIIGGEFGSVGGVPASRVAKWNGSAWQNMGTGLPDLVKTFAVFNDTVYAGLDAEGSPTIYKWNGSSWVVAGPMTKPVNVLFTDTVANPDVLYAGGSFTTPGFYIAKTTNGMTWMGTGTGLSAGSNTFPAVHSITRYRDTIYVGGTFGAGSSVPYMAKHNGTSWQRVHALHPDNSVNSFAIWKDTLFVAGNFSYLWTGANPKFYHIRLVKLYKGNWVRMNQPADSLVGPADDVKSIVPFNCQLYATGFFQSIIGSSTQYNGIGRWNRHGWNTVTTGLGVNKIGYALYRSGETLYVGGNFSKAGGVTGAYNIAKWTNPCIGCPDTSYFEGDLDVDIPNNDSCITQKIYGCTDSLYVEYNPNANIDDGSCVNLVGIDEIIGDNISLSISPNPIGNETSLLLWLKENTTVEVQLFSIQGHLMQTLVNNINYGPGDHSIHIQSENLSSGMYVLSIRFNDITKNYKVIHY